MGNLGNYKKYREPDRYGLQDRDRMRDIETNRERERQRETH